MGASPASCSRATDVPLEGDSAKRLTSGRKSAGRRRSSGKISVGMPRRVRAIGAGPAFGRARGAMLLAPVSANPKLRHWDRVAASSGPVGRSIRPRPLRTAAMRAARWPPSAAQLRSSITMTLNRPSVAALMAIGASPSEMPPPALIWLVTSNPASVAQRRRYLISGPGAAARSRRRCGFGSRTTSGTEACAIVRSLVRTRKVKRLFPAARAVPVRRTCPCWSGVVLSVTRPAGSSNSTIALFVGETVAPTSKLSPGAAAVGGVRERIPLL